MNNFFANFFGKGGSTILLETAAKNSSNKHYRLVQDSYTGHGGFSDGGYLEKYNREEEADFTKRKSQAYYLNLMGPIIDSVINPVFSQDILRQYDAPLFDPFVEDADGKGASLTMFMKQATTIANVMGQSFIAMDSFPEDEIPPTQAEQINERKVPFVSLKTPLDVYNYTADKFEKLLSITFYNGKTEDGYQILRKYDANYITEYYISGKEEVILTKVAHGIGVIPVIPTMYGDILPVPPTLSLAQASKTLYNQLSELRELSRDSNFSLLVIPGADPKIAIEVGSKNSLFVPKDVANMPTYISPDTGINANTLAEIKFTVESILSQGELKGAAVQTSNMSVKSGVALAFEFHGNVEALDSNGDIAEGIEEKIAELFGRYTSPFEFEVEYNRDYTPFSGDDIQKQFKFLKEVLAENLSDEINAEIKVLILELVKYNSSIDDDRFKELKETIKVLKQETTIEPDLETEDGEDTQDIES